MLHIRMRVIVELGLNIAHEFVDIYAASALITWPVNKRTEKKKN